MHEPASPNAARTRPPSGRERRQHQRASASWPLSVSLDDGDYEARLRDVSRAGISFFMEEPIPMMTLLRIGIDLPGERGPRRVTAQGAVVRCEPISDSVAHYEVAVFLHDMAETDREALDSYVRKHEPS